MHCPFCKAKDTKVIDSRLSNEGNTIRRRRECLQCLDRFTTYEAIEMSFPRIVKRDGRRCNFDENKLRRGMLTALEKRPVTAAQIDAAITCIKNRLRNSNEREVTSTHLGKWLMAELRQLDCVAYLRFASVYLYFDHIDAFIEEIKKLRLT